MMILVIVLCLKIYDIPQIHAIEVNSASLSVDYSGWEKQ